MRIADFLYRFALSFLLDDYLEKSASDFVGLISFNLS